MRARVLSCVCARVHACVYACVIVWTYVCACVLVCAPPPTFESPLYLRPSAKTNCQFRRPTSIEEKTLCAWICCCYFAFLFMFFLCLPVLNCCQCLRSSIHLRRILCRGSENKLPASETYNKRFWVKHGKKICALLLLFMWLFCSCLRGRNSPVLGTSFQ